MSVSGDAALTASAAIQAQATTTPMQMPSLADQIAAVAGQDSLLIGASGYMDDVFTTRLWGDTS